MNLSWSPSGKFVGESTRKRAPKPRKNSKPLASHCFPRSQSHQLRRLECRLPVVTQCGAIALPETNAHSPPTPYPKGQAWLSLHKESRGFPVGFRDPGFASLEVGIWDFKAKRGRDSGLKVCAGCGMPKITSGITGLTGNLNRNYGIERKFELRLRYWAEILGRDYGAEEPY